MNYDVLLLIKLHRSKAFKISPNLTRCNISDAYTLMHHTHYSEIGRLLFFSVLFDFFLFEYFYTVVLLVCMCGDWAMHLMTAYILVCN